MTILAFWSVDSDIERYDLDSMSHEEAFRILWTRRKELDVRFYDVESFYCDDAYGLQQFMGNADDFTEDYNDEELDGGQWWCKAMLIPSDDVKQIINE